MYISKKVMTISFYFVFLFLLLISFHTIIFSRLLPFIDLPYQLALATIFKYYGDVNNQFSDYFLINSLIRPNNIHFLFTGSNLFSTIEKANLFYYCTYIILLPISIYIFIKKLNGNIWFTLLTFCFLFNYSVYWGFVENTMALPFYFFFMYCSLIYIEKNSIINKVLFCLSLCFLCYLHVLIGFFALFVYIIYIFSFTRKSYKFFLKHVGLALIFVLPYIYWFFINSTYFIHNVDSSISEYLSKLVQLEPTIIRLKNLLIIDYIIFPFKFKILKFSSITFILLFFISFLFLKDYYDNKRKRGLILVYISSILAAVFYFFLPDGMLGIHCLFSRFSILFFLSSIIISSTIFSNKKNNLIIVIPIIILSLFITIKTNLYFQNFNEKNKNFTKDLFPVHQKDEILTAIIEDVYFSNKPVYMHFQNYHIVWNKGIAFSTLYNYAFSKISKKITLL